MTTATKDRIIDLLNKLIGIKQIADICGVTITDINSLKHDYYAKTESLETGATGGHGRHGGKSTAGNASKGTAGEG